MWSRYDRLQAPAEAFEVDGERGDIEVSDGLPLKPSDERLSEARALRDRRLGDGQPTT
jgi:hypothetical protein